MAWSRWCGSDHAECRTRPLHTFLFFELRPGLAHEIEGPTGVLPSGWDYCEAEEQNYASVGSVASIPAVLSENDSEGSDHVKIAMTPWQGGHWGYACRIEATFAGTITVSEAFCRITHQSVIKATKDLTLRRQ
jgi:hypothetical protein